MPYPYPYMPTISELERCTNKYHEQTGKWI